MLRLIDKFRDLSFQKLMKVYRESLQENGAEFYSHLSSEAQMMEAEQDFYCFLNTFYRSSGACYYIWEENDHYISALRLEPYQDGLLIEALETDPEYRNNGYASRLVNAVLEYVAQKGTHKIYSHIHRKNAVSIAIHEKNGFQKILNHAVYIDRSVSHQCCTYLKML